MKLGKRLSEISKLVSYRRIADIGTDHGKIPISLILNNKADFVIASDINQGPVDACERNIKKFGNLNISVRKGAGLSTVAPGECESIIIAGMGGDLICNILSNDIKTARDAKELILQPMTGAETVRYFLWKNNFLITEEKLVSEDEKVYVIIKTVTGGRNQFENFYFDKIILNNDSCDIDKYYVKVSKYLDNRIAGLKKDGRNDDYNEYLKIRESVKLVYESTRNS